MAPVLAVKVTVCPAQAATEAPLVMVAVGNGFTVTVIGSVVFVLNITLVLFIGDPLFLNKAA